MCAILSVFSLSQVSANQDLGTMQIGNRKSPSGPHRHLHGFLSPRETEMTRPRVLLWPVGEHWTIRCRLRTVQKFTVEHANVLPPGPITSNFCSTPEAGRRSLTAVLYTTTIPQMALLQAYLP